MKPTTRVLSILHVFLWSFGFVTAAAAEPSGAPYPQSKLIMKLTWDPAVVRIGEGNDGRDGVGDNWPATWGDDGSVYVSYGDGPGFNKRGDQFFTLGFAKIIGDPPSLRAEDIPSDLDTPVGWGNKGIKSSGQIMVDRVIYMFVRNYQVNGDYRHSRLAWSGNRQKNWRWAQWHFAETFGCPEFVQFGPNYAGARDNYVYVASQANNDAYDFSTDIVLARVPKDRITVREAYRFYAGLDGKGVPVWTADIGKRAPVFKDPKGTQRISLGYNQALKRYILTSSHRVGPAPHNASLGVFEAPEPWGPWSTVYYDDYWSGSHRTYHHRFPTKWMSPDGRTMWLLYSGIGGNNYAFILRKATLACSAPHWRSLRPTCYKDSMKALFVGGTGIISSACARLAVELGIDLTLVTRGKRAAGKPAGVRTVNVDIDDQAAAAQALGEETFDAVVDWIAYTPAHVERDLNLFRGRTGQYIFISSASAYQRPVAHYLITESTPLANPYWQYSRDKIACEQRLMQAYGEEGFPATIVRPSLTYGETQVPLAVNSWTKSYTVIDRMRRGKKVIVPGDGSSLWVITHSTDFAKGLVGLLGQTPAVGQAFHITSDEVLCWDQFYRIAAEAAGAEPRLVHMASDFIAECIPEKLGSLTGDKASSVVFDNSKIKRFVPGYCATVPFAEGIRGTLAWFDAAPARKQVDQEADALFDRLIDAYEHGTREALKRFRS